MLLAHFYCAMRVPKLLLIVSIWYNTNSVIEIQEKVLDYWHKVKCNKIKLTLGLVRILSFKDLCQNMYLVKKENQRTCLYQ